MGPETTLIVFCACVVAASAAGGLVPLVVRLNHRRMQFGLSFVSGVMLGVAVFHMLPHALMARMESGAAAGGDAHGLFDPLMVALAVGFLAMFFLQRFAHFHQHEAPEPACDDPMHGHDGHHHHHAHEHPVGRLTWAGAAVGMGLHSLLEGVALAASVEAARGGETLAGFGTFLVILLHKPFDAMTLVTLFSAGGRVGGRVHLLNLAYGLVVPVGAGLFIAGVGSADSSTVALALAFSAGTFLCIAGSDLLPELQFHRHDRVLLSVLLTLGLALAWGVGRLEAASHGHDPSHAAHGHDAAADHGHTETHP